MRLKREGYRDVVEVDSGRATLDYLAQQHVDLVLGYLGDRLRGELRALLGIEYAGRSIALYRLV